MLKLENVSTLKLLNSYKRLSSKSELYRCIYEFLSINNISNYKELKELLFSNHKELINSAIMIELMSELKRVELLIQSYDMCFKNPDIFTFDNYSHSDLDNKTISVTDSANKGDILLFSSPFLNGGARKNGVKYLSIAEIKQFLEHVEDTHLVNLLSSVRSLGPVISKRIYDSICFYEEQVLRCADETCERGIDLFGIDRLEKREIVSSELKEICEYIVDTASILVWGELSDFQKKRLITTAMSTRGEYIQRDRNILVDTISNYTTLSELKDGVVKKKTLDRFIVKKR